MKENDWINHGNQVKKHKKVRAFQALFQIFNSKKLLLCWKCQQHVF